MKGGGVRPLFNKQQLLPQKEWVVKFNRTNVRYFDWMGAKYLDGRGYFMKKEWGKVFRIMIEVDSRIGSPGSCETISGNPGGDGNQTLKP